MDISLSFEPLNTSITLLYISCKISTLLLDLFITLDKLEIMLEKALNLLKMILSQHAFFERRPKVGLKVFLTDNLSIEHNTLELCWPESNDSTLNLSCLFF